MAFDYGRVELRQYGMALYTAARPDCSGNGLHQWSMFFEPLAVEAVDVTVVTFSEAINEFIPKVRG